MAHFVMVQYKEKEGIVNDGSKSEGKDHWYTLDEWCAPPRGQTCHDPKDLC